MLYTNTMVNVLPYCGKSESGKEIAEALGVKRILRKGSEYRGKPDRIVINWGSSRIPPHVQGSRLINREFAVGVAVDKIASFISLHLHGVPCPNFTANPVAAHGWIDEGSSVLCRTDSKGCDGAGIVLADTHEQVVPAPLYVKYVEKTDEYRVIVVDGEAIACRKKVRADDFEGDELNERIRTSDGGYGFGRELIDAKGNNCLHEPKILAVAVKAVQALGLDFGGVDVGYNKKTGQIVVYEVNTAFELTPLLTKRLSKALGRLCHKVAEEINPQ